MLVAAGETIHLSTGDKRDYSSTKEVIDRPFSRGEVTGNLLEEGKASLKIQDVSWINLGSGTPPLRKCLSLYVQILNNLESDYFELS